MATPLEKARRDPTSMKGRILDSARRLFGSYGFHGTTTRMIAKDVGIDISTFHYHWGDKVDLYESVIADINEGLRQQLLVVEEKIRGLPLRVRVEMAVGMMIDYLFANPEIANLTILQYFTRTRMDSDITIKTPDFLSDIAFSMGLAGHRRKVSREARMKVLVMTNAIYSFTSGRQMFERMLESDRETYVAMVKETLNFYFAAPFGEGDDETGNTGA